MRIASLNSLSDPEMIGERVAQVFVEADHLNVDVLALQEVPEEYHPDFVRIADAHGYSSSRLGSGVPGDGTGIFSRIPITDAGTLVVEHPSLIPAGDEPARRFVWAEVNGFLVINAHLTWGAHNEPKRLREVAGIEAFAAETVSTHTVEHGPDATELVPILTGDFNAEPDNDCVRFLRGKTPIDGVGTYWTEATLGTEFQHTPTTRERNHWGQQSARSQGLDASLLYPRRIDFIFVRGWRHGGRGTLRGTVPFGTTLTPEGFDVSDHFGWVTDVQE